MLCHLENLFHTQNVIQRKSCEIGTTTRESVEWGSCIGDERRKSNGFQRWRDSQEKGQ
jgi:hypothetical protein